MNDCGYLLMSIGEVRGYSVFCTLIDPDAAVPRRNGEQFPGKRAAEIQLTWAKVVLAGLGRPLALISSRTMLAWWLDLPLGEWAFFPTFTTREFLIGMERTTFLPCTRWQDNGPILFQELGFPELTTPMWDWMELSLKNEFDTYDGHLFSVLLKNRLALVAKRLPN